MHETARIRQIRFSRVTDSPKEAVDLIIRSLPAEVKRARFKGRLLAEK